LTATAEEMKRISKVKFTAKQLNTTFEEIGSSPLKNTMSMADLLKRPEINYDILSEVDVTRPDLDRNVIKQCEIQIKYVGYIEKQKQQINRFKALESKQLSPDIDYGAIKGIRIEARQKLTQIKPTSIGQATRISGVSPADISVLMVFLEQSRRRK
jgi:tRNA uridine 5-carboxymethylaminomethyl modification enzyme